MVIRMSVLRRTVCDVTRQTFRQSERLPQSQMNCQSSVAGVEK